jgi:hypothetical protein
MFRKVRTSETGSESYGRPSTATSDGKRRQATAMILKDRKITRDTASTLDITEG